MTQPEEFPAEPAPAQPAQPAQPAETPQPPVPAEWAQQAQAPQQQPDAAQVQAWPQPVDPAVQAAAFAYTQMPSPEEQAAAAAKKAKRRSVFAKSAILAVPALALVALLVGTSVESSSFTSKHNDATAAAKAADQGGNLAAPLKAAESAAQNSILVDAGCVAVESQATTDFETKVGKDDDALAKADQGNSISAYLAAVDKYVSDLQGFSTALEQDGALSSRSSVKAAVDTVAKDLGVFISTMQAAETGNLSNNALNQLDSAVSRMDADTTAVDSMCGGTILNGGPDQNLTNLVA
ncbi:hypothetical protein [Actinospica robiniae]|uniref:hypothetical protein n=1 Tax=Actinospica robiniae TaxID=304901 RepID=UPI00041DC349|nr:hypothetical protein [Actinospica robiniae]